MRKRLWLAGAAALVLGSAAPWSPAPALAAGNESQMAAEIASHINAERAARGLSRVPVEGSYSAGAQRVAESNRERSCDACHSTTFPSGEVVYWSSGDASGAATVWWMNSPGHRALLMAPDAKRLGVGVACSGTEYQAVGWIETENPPASVPAAPIVTSRASGSKCQGVAPKASPSTTARPSPTSTPPDRTKTSAAATPAENATTATSVARRGGRTTATTTPGQRRRERAAAASVSSSGKRPRLQGNRVVLDTGMAPDRGDGARQLDAELTGRSDAAAARASGLGDVTPIVLAAVFAGSLLAGWAARRRDQGAARPR